MSRGASAMRAYRARNAAYTLRNGARSAARSAALEVLARQHPEEFAALYRAELDEAGVAPVQMARPCPCGGVIHRKGPTGRWPQKCDKCKGGES